MTFIEVQQKKDEKNKIKVIFLDLDGVLAVPPDCDKIIKRIQKPNGDRLGLRGLKPSAIDQLNRVTDTTGAKIVLSTMWRYWFKSPEEVEILKSFLKENGVTGNVIGRTPTPDEYPTPKLSIIECALPRGKEIELWLNGAVDIESFVIVDDMSDMEPFMDKLVITKFEDGITAKDADEMIRILNHKSSNIF